jgi:hypothetical protein
MIDDGVSISNNPPQMHNDTMDQLLEAGRTELHPEKRRDGSYPNDRVETRLVPPSRKQKVSST